MIGPSDTGESTGRPLADADYRSLAEFRHALRLFVRVSERAARDAGVTPAQHQLLLAIRGHDGPHRPAIGDLAEALQRRHHSTVGLIDRAEVAGLIRRRTDPDDQRRHLVGLTEQGAAVLEDLSILHRDELRRFRTRMVDVLKELDPPG